MNIHKPHCVGDEDRGGEFSDPFPSLTQTQCADWKGEKRSLSISCCPGCLGAL